MRRVVITGLGAIAGNGDTAAEFFESCEKGKSGIKKCTAFDTSGLLTDSFGQADLSAQNRLHALIDMSVNEMLKSARIDKQYLACAGGACKLFIGTLLSTSENYYNHSKLKSIGEPDNGTLAEMNSYISYIKNSCGVKGTVNVSSAACASGTTAAGMAFDYIRSGLCDMAVAGGADPLNIIAAYGFNALKSLSSGVCNPYDQNRDGINIGECGVFFFVEELEHAKARNAKIYCEIAGCGLGNDAYHITSPEPNGEGAYHTMLAALADGGISPDDVDYINGHGTGTPINDSMEIKAVERLFNNTDKIPAVSSTKALIGHCMGASGAIELASIILSMQSGRYIPMPNLTDKISDKVMLSPCSFDIDINYALSNSFAFAGNSASLLIKKYDRGDER